MIASVFITGCQDKPNYDINVDEYKEYKVSRLKNRADDIIGAFSLTDGNHSVICQEVGSKGYNGLIKSLVYIDSKDDTVSKIVVLEENETEDYGGYVTEEWYLKRYYGKGVDKPLKTVVMSSESDDQIVAITGATITSHAITKSVNKAMVNYKLIKGE